MAGTLEKAKEMLRLLARDRRAFGQRMVGCGPAQRMETALLNLTGKGSRNEVNRHFFRVLGMQRVGNHAIVNWIGDSIGGSTVHLNNVVVGKNGYRHRDIYPERNDSPEVKAHIRAARYRNFLPLDGLVISYEDHSVAEFEADGADPRLAEYYGTWGQRREILLLRDPYNLFASRLKSNKIATKVAGMDHKQMFIDHAETFLREREGDRMVCISYNDWHRNEAYRLAVQQRLGIEPREVARDKVTGHGGGSSFDGLGMRGRGSEMPVLSRWRAMEDDPRFQALFADGVLARYSDAIFGDVRAVS